MKITDVKLKQLTGVMEVDGPLLITQRRALRIAG